MIKVQTKVQVLVACSGCPSCTKFQSILSPKSSVEQNKTGVEGTRARRWDGEFFFSLVSCRFPALVRKKGHTRGAHAARQVVQELVSIVFSFLWQIWQGSVCTSSSCFILGIACNRLLYLRLLRSGLLSDRQRSIVSESVSIPR